MSGTSVPLLVPQVTRYLLDDVFLNAALSSKEKLRELFLCTGGLTAVFIVVFAPGVYIRHYFADKASHRARAGLALLEMLRREAVPGA